MSPTDTAVPLPGFTDLLTVILDSTGLVVVQVKQVPVPGTTLLLTEVVAVAFTVAV